MRLSSLLPSVRQDDGYTELVRRLDSQPSSTFSILDAAKPALLAALHGESDRPVILLVSRQARARQLAQELQVWSNAPDSIHLFPDLDALPYERLPTGPEHLYDRLEAMLALATVSESSGPKPLVVVTARAAMDRIMAADVCRGTLWKVRVGDRIRPDQLIREWVQAGYEPVSVVEGPGEFARRGGIIDIYPLGPQRGGPVVDAPHPAFRIELWGNDVDSIRVLDPATQRSGEPVEQVLIGPAHEVLLGRTAVDEELREALDLSHARPRVRDEIENELRMLGEGQPFPLLEWYRGVLGTASILDYLPGNGLLVVDEPGAVASTARSLQRQAEELAVELLDRGEAPGRVPRPYWTWEELTDRRRSGTSDSTRQLDLTLDPDALEGSFVPASTYHGALQQLIDSVKTPSLAAAVPSPKTLVVSQQSARIGEMLTEQGVRFVDVTDGLPSPSPSPSPAAAREGVMLAAASAAAAGEAVMLAHGILGEGGANTASGLTVLTDREIFGWAKVRRHGRRLSVAARDRFLSDLEPGEMVVHVDHGIGRYRGLVRISDRESGLEREYLDIEYGENGRLRVPVEHADRISPYVGAGEALPTLTKLGSGEWQRAKHRIRAAVQRIAKELVELYARRELAEAVALGPDTPWQMELEASFPYVETADQLQATAEVKQDMERPRPMDRLLVGDVGYGKTEVALRAAFKAVNYGKQVAMLVPTTVLAQQHLQTFRERLAPFPVRVEMLSRFLTDRQAREVVEAVAEGKVDIVIGTHRLLQKDVGFKELGLVIIDEEQRFGVSHKERFKELRTEVHVLSLSATPIPRTLHLSLVGVRDLSMIQTPPEERLPIRTSVAEQEEGQIREAILRELDRGGQVFYVSNRVHSIGSVAARLSALVPEARISIGHGQMGDDELEEAMLTFANGDADVLVCTTIIEAGLDLPNVNTIIVTNADQFGLSQLYQLRGRVGRASNRAYAYFLYPRDRQLTEIAEKRLRAIFEATELGAGYRIALKDLEIRGAGNLLGVEQHGHISAVGFYLYCRLLAEAVDQLKKLRDQALEPHAASMNGELQMDRVLSGAAIEITTASINLPLNASLPNDYVQDESARLNLYQRLASVREGPALGELMSEIEDRFGPPPEPAMNLFYLLSLRIAATEADVEEILVDSDQIVVRFKSSRPLNAAQLGRAAGVVVEARSNQVRIPLGRGMAWMPHVRDLVEALQAVKQVV